MKFTFTFILLAFLAVFAAAAHPQQQPVVVSYPKDTPQSVIDKAMAAIKQAVCYNNNNRNLTSQSTR